MKYIAYRLSFSIFTVMQKINALKFETDWRKLPSKRGEASFIDQDFNSLNSSLFLLEGPSNYLKITPYTILDRFEIGTKSLLWGYV